jgi:uroporphyrinogen decarboxylase
MKGIVLTGHVLEDPMGLFGYEGLSYALVDQPDLVDAVFERIGRLYELIYEYCVQHEAVGAMLISDDLGFRSGTMISPTDLRRLVFPWYKRYCDIVHQYDKPVILHSCGNLTEVIGDIVDCGIDAKHSYEDVIMPIEEVKKSVGDKMAILGGVDVDFLCRASEKEVRVRTREVLEACMPGGGYALGTGNSVTNYIPIANYLAMLDEGRKVGRY